jgi:hypothetical protein
MKCSLFTLSFVAALVLCILVSNSPTFADAGVFTGNGQNLHQITSKTIRLESIDVNIVLERGPFLFDGTVPGMDRAEYICTFVLQNLSVQPEDVQVGFPVDSQFSEENDKISAEQSKNWVLEYSFIARDATTTYHVEFVHRKPERGAGEFSSIFTWRMHFDRNETKTLNVQYRIPMSMGLASTRKDPNTFASGGSALSQELLEIATLDQMGYITSTGSSWSGNVKKAKFTVLTAPFEKYLYRRGFTEEEGAELKGEQLDRYKSSFPVAHPWWFRRIKPGGWKAIEGGVQWEYEDFKPKDAIEISYYVTQVPSLPEEVDPFLDRFLAGLGPNELAATELGHMKEIVLAIYGKEPTEVIVKNFVSQQLWYAPKGDFSAAGFTEAQKAVLNKIDERIAATKNSKPPN